jgi:hypothetical protein
LKKSTEVAMKALACYATGLALLALAGFASADARDDYFQQAAQRDTATFKALDANHDGVLERSEVVGDNDFGSRFGAMDRNGDGVVTGPELALYISEHYGVAATSADKATMATHHVADTSAPGRG